MNDEQSTQDVSNSEMQDSNMQVNEQEKEVQKAPVKNSTRRKPIILAVIAALILISSIVGLLVLTNNDDSVANNDVIVNSEQEAVTTLGVAIVSIEGTVETSNDGDTWKVAVAGQSLANLDYVRTLDTSRAIVLFDDGSVVRLDENTELYLSSLEADALEVTLMKGQVYSRVVESENQTFTVVTSNERFQALGTAYKTSTDGTKDELEVYQSAVKVESENLDVDEGNKYDTTNKEKIAIDLELLDEDDFAQWNKLKDSESEEFKDKLGVLKDRQQEPAPAPVQSGSTAGIVLSGSKADSGVNLSWKLSGVSSAQGFKIVRSATDNTPTYGENDAIYVGDSSARSSKWYSDNGGTHYYRVCIYFEGTCSTYSNAIQLTSPKIEKEPVVSGAVNLSIDGQTLTWNLSGGNAPHGYKIVMSNTPSPVYPANSIKYVGADSLTANLPEKVPGTYYVRVCKYTNGTQDAGCVDYSNEVEYVISS